MSRTEDEAREKRAELAGYQAGLAGWVNNENPYRAAATRISWDNGWRRGHAERRRTTCWLCGTKRPESDMAFRGPAGIWVCSQAIGGCPPPPQRGTLR